jgi:hypothetical protein
MAVPATRAQFKEYCLRKLGKPVIEINVDDDQVEDRIDESIRYFQTELSRWIHAQTGLQRFRFSGRYKWSIVNEVRHFYNVYDYIHQIIQKLR